MVGVTINVTNGGNDGDGGIKLKIKVMVELTVVLMVKIDFKMCVTNCVTSDGGSGTKNRDGKMCNTILQNIIHRVMKFIVKQLEE